MSSEEYASATIDEKSRNVVVAVCMVSCVAVLANTVDESLICDARGVSEVFVCMNSSGLSEGFFDFIRGLGRGLGFAGASAVWPGERSAGLTLCDSPGGVKSDPFEMSGDWRARSGVWGRAEKVAVCIVDAEA